jgi:hypothetical protein
MIVSSEISERISFCTNPESFGAIKQDDLDIDFQQGGKQH